MKDIDKLRNVIIGDIKSIPDFINTHSTIHRNIWSHLQLILRIISRLTNEKVLSDKKIIEYHELTGDAILLILNALDKYISEIEISHYLIDKIDKYERIAIDNELYEVAANFQSYKKLYMNVV